MISQGWHTSNLILSMIEYWALLDNEGVEWGGGGGGCDAYEEG
jgi:hypothetical protein